MPQGRSASRAAGCVSGLEREWQRVSLSRYVPADRSRAQVEQVLLSEARVLAVQEAVGITIATTTTRTQYEAMSNGSSREYRDHFIELYSQDAAGLIIEERHRTTRPGADSLALVYEARVACDAGGEAAGFSASVTTNQLVYRVGDAISIAVNATDPARLYLFTVLQDGSARLVFPNVLDTLNGLSGGATRTVPPRNASYDLTAELDPRFGAAQAELLLGIFYTGDGPGLFRARDAGRVEFSLEQINRVLLQVPRAQRSRVAVGYEIRAR